MKKKEVPIGITIGASVCFIVAWVLSLIGAFGQEGLSIRLLPTIIWLCTFGLCIGIEIAIVRNQR